jgi:uncharacterized membrane-anchored protein
LDFVSYKVRSSDAAVVGATVTWEIILIYTSLRCSWIESMFVPVTLPVSAAWQLSYCRLLVSQLILMKEQHTVIV